MLLCNMIGIASNAERDDLQIEVEKDKLQYVPI